MPSKCQVSLPRGMVPIDVYPCLMLLFDQSIRHDTVDAMQLKLIWYINGSLCQKYRPLLFCGDDFYKSSPSRPELSGCGAYLSPKLYYCLSVNAIELMLIFALQYLVFAKKGLPLQDPLVDTVDRLALLHRPAQSFQLACHLQTHLLHPHQATEVKLLVLLQALALSSLALLRHLRAIRA